MTGCCEICMHQASIEPAIHNKSLKHCYVCHDVACRAQVTLVDWQAQWRDYYQALEARRQQQQELRKSFGQVA